MRVRKRKAQERLEGTSFEISGKEVLRRVFTTLACEEAEDSIRMLANSCPWYVRWRVRVGLFFTKRKLRRRGYPVGINYGQAKRR